MATANGNGNGNGTEVFGLKGWAGTLANLSAVAVICFLVVVEMPRQQQSNRDELRAIREHDDRRTDRITMAIEKLGLELRTQRLGRE